MAAIQQQNEAQPDLEHGIDYWNQQSADYNGVLGGFGNGSLPRVDALGSRQFLLYLRPDLCQVESALRLLKPTPPSHRIRAVDVGAGVGRVTSDVLLNLVSDIVLLEPVGIFIQEGFKQCSASQEQDEPTSSFVPWKGMKNKTKSVNFIQGTLQDFDPSHPQERTKPLGRIGFIPDHVNDDLESGFDIVWCQWCLGHLSDPDLVAFFKRCKNALRDSKSFIIVKENLCSNADDGGPLTVFDPDDSSVTRSDSAWKEVFKQAGLTLLHQKVQLGFPIGLFEVKM
ncbi:methyltransferase domain-containing protein [Abortiporus biennis]|nr:methyltransferase domain-containing protein [Abortiporus biennis]